MEFFILWIINYVNITSYSANVTYDKHSFVRISMAMHWKWRKLCLFKIVFHPNGWMSRKKNSLIENVFYNKPHLHTSWKCILIIAFDHRFLDIQTSLCRNIHVYCNVFSVICTSESLFLHFNENKIFIRIVSHHAFEIYSNTVSSLSLRIILLTFYIC